MQTPEVSPSPSTKGSSSSRASFAEPGISSYKSDGTGSKTRTIGIALKAHKELTTDPFAYAFQNLIERSSKVVVICCMSRIHSEMGVEYRIDTQAFAGVNSKVLSQAVEIQMKSLKHFLRSFRAQLEQRGVQLDIKIPTGPNSEEVLIQAVRALHPHWVVLDSTFSRQRKRLEQELYCNLVLMRGKQPPKVIRLNQKMLGPVGLIDGGPVSEDMEPEPSESTPYSSHEPTSEEHTSPTSTPSAPSTTTRIHTVSMIEESVKTTRVNKTFSCFTCLCVSVADDQEDHGSRGESDPPAPTRQNAVLFGEDAERPATYLGPLGDPKFPSIADQHRNIDRSSSPASSSGHSWLNFTTSNTSVRSSKRSVVRIEAELKATMRQPALEDDDDPVWIQQL